MAIIIKVITNIVIILFDMIVFQHVKINGGKVFQCHHWYHHLYSHFLFNKNDRKVWGHHQKTQWRRPRLKRHHDSFVNMVVMLMLMAMAMVMVMISVTNLLNCKHVNIHCLQRRESSYHVMKTLNLNWDVVKWWFGQNVLKREKSILMPILHAGSSCLKLIHFLHHPHIEIIIIISIISVTITIIIILTKWSIQNQPNFHPLLRSISILLGLSVHSDKDNHHKPHCFQHI